MEIRIVIPARMASTRLPGKPMEMIGDKTLVEHVYDKAIQTGFPVTILTDSESMKEALTRCDVRVTAPQILTGTDRIAWARTHFKEDIIINCQGDVPFIEPHQILLPAMLLYNFDVGTLITDPPPESSAGNKNIARAICTQRTGTSQQYNCRWFTRTHISYGYQHIGVYAYGKDMFSGWDFIKSGIEQYEDLEQIRFLERGLTVGAIKTDVVPIEVNTPEDLDKARSHYESQR